MNHDRIADFSFYRNYYGDGYRFEVYPKNPKNQVWGELSQGDNHSCVPSPVASALSAGVTIGSNSTKFLNGRSNIMREFFSCAVGQWAPFKWKGAKNKYLGFKFYIKENVHYGWARINMGPRKVQLTGYAYESIPNKPIVTGKTHGRGEATLGRLAQGASGVVVRRQEQ